MYKEINYESIRQIRPGDSYYENDNWVKITINNSRTINRNEETILNHYVTEGLNFCL